MRSFRKKSLGELYPIYTVKVRMYQIFIRKRACHGYSLIDLGVCVAYVKGQCRQNEITQRPCDTKISLEATALLKNSIDAPFH